MPALIVRGATLTLDVFITGSEGLVNPLDLAVSILDPAGAVFEDGLVPVLLSLGHYKVEFPVPADADLGAWAAHWTCTIDGAPAVTEDGFTVVAPGSISSGSSSGQTCSPWATHEDSQLTAAQSYGADPDDIDDMMQMATDVLYNFTGKAYPGICTDSIRPLAQYRALEGPPRWWPAIAGAGGGRGSMGFCSCHRIRDAGCFAVSEVKLPNAPVIEASIAVVLDGDPFLDWELRDHRYLARTDGHGWPCCQRDLPDTELGTWSVTWQWGRLPPIGGRFACAALGSQLYLAFHPEASDSGACKLPKRIQTITRQGVTIAMLDPLKLFDEGKTGLPEVDLWVASILLGRKRRRATALVPGHSRSARRVGR